MLEYKDFLVVGHPRGGTTYSSKLFKTFGFDVGHEKVNASGTASWLFGSPQGWNFWTDKMKRDQYYFKWTFLNVRHPLSVITSLITEHAKNQESLKLVSQWTGHTFNNTDPIALATERYLFWDNYLWETNNIDFWFRVENDQKKLYDYLKFLGYEPFYHLGEGKINEHVVPRNINTRPKVNDNLTLEDIPVKLRGAVENKISYYGYSLEY